MNSLSRRLKILSGSGIVFNLILEEDMKLSREEIMDRMEKLKDGESLKFSIPEIFGGGVAIIGFNPKRSEKDAKKYLLEIRDGEEVKPYWDTNKAKDLAKWVADRQGDLV
jgi:DNA-binding Lrp family transcriptional regulator